MKKLALTVAFVLACGFTTVTFAQDPVKKETTEKQDTTQSKSLTFVQEPEKKDSTENKTENKSLAFVQEPEKKDSTEKKDTTENKSEKSFC